MPQSERAASEYEGFFAEFYDLLQPSAPEAGAIGAIARECGGPILELGCGTGRLLLPLATAGFDVTGLDLFPDMLRICARKERFEFVHPETHHRIVSRFTPRYDFAGRTETDEIVLEEYAAGKLVRRAEAKVTLATYDARDIVPVLPEAGLRLVGEYGSLRRESRSRESRSFVLIASKCRAAGRARCRASRPT